MFYSHKYNAFVFESDYNGYNGYTENWDAKHFSYMTYIECAEEAHRQAKIHMEHALETLDTLFMYNDVVRGRSYFQIHQELLDDLPNLVAHFYWFFSSADE